MFVSRYGKLLMETPYTKNRPAVTPYASNAVSSEIALNFKPLVTEASIILNIMNVILKVSEYQGAANPDVNGLTPVFCSVIAGSYPRSMVVMSGSSAAMHKLEVDKTYLVSINDTNRVREYQTHDGKTGRSKEWSLTNLGEITSPVELLQASSLIGDSNIIDDVIIGNDAEVAEVAEEVSNN